MGTEIQPDPVVDDKPGRHPWLWLLAGIATAGLAFLAYLVWIFARIVNDPQDALSDD